MNFASDPQRPYVRFTVLWIDIIQIMWAVLSEAVLL